MKLLLEGVHFLIAEDNPTNQIVIAKIIEGLGGSFDLASDGLEAIHLYNPKVHDMALLDIEMPQKSGLEVIHHIRSRPDTPQGFPIAALTAFVLADHRTKIREAGADLIVAKPIVDVKKFAEDLRMTMNQTLTSKIESENFNPTSLLEMEESIGREVMPELLASLIADLGQLSSSFDELSNQADADKLKSSAHGLVSLAATAGFDALSVQARELEQNVNKLTLNERAASAVVLRSETNLLIEELNSFGQRYHSQ